MSAVGDALVTLARSSAEEISRALPQLSVADYDRLCIVLIRAWTQRGKANKAIAALLARDA
jgi:uncharacterized protein YggU (UPF0235/DUF167 family)